MKHSFFKPNYGQPKFFTPKSVIQLFNPRPPSKNYIKKKKKLRKNIGWKNFFFNFSFLLKNLRKKIYFLRKKKKKFFKKKKLEIFSKLNFYFFYNINQYFLFKIKSINLYFPFYFLTGFRKKFKKIFFFKKILNPWIFFWGNSFFNLKFKKFTIKKNFKKLLQVFL
jgi:hypothetical protein